MELTLEELKKYDGSDPTKAIYISIKGRIFDVSEGKSFYGPDGPYSIFAGKDATRALAKMSKDPNDVVSSLDGLSDKELSVLVDWENKFLAKYPIVATLIP